MTQLMHLSLMRLPDSNRIIREMYQKPSPPACPRPSSEELRSVEHVQRLYTHLYMLIVLIRPLTNPMTGNLDTREITVPVLTVELTKQLTFLNKPYTEEGGRKRMVASMAYMVPSDFMYSALRDSIQRPPPLARIPPAAVPHLCLLEFMSFLASMWGGQLLRLQIQGRIPLIWDSEQEFRTLLYGSLIREDLIPQLHPKPPQSISSATTLKVHHLVDLMRHSYRVIGSERPNQRDPEFQKVLNIYFHDFASTLVHKGMIMRYLLALMKSKNPNYFHQYMGPVTRLAIVLTTWEINNRGPPKTSTTQVILLPDPTP